MQWLVVRPVVICDIVNCCAYESIIIVSFVLIVVVAVGHQVYVITASFTALCTSLMISEVLKGFN